MYFFLYSWICFLAAASGSGVGGAAVTAEISDRTLVKVEINFILVASNCGSREGVGGIQDVELGQIYQLGFISAYILATVQ